MLQTPLVCAIRWHQEARGLAKAPGLAYSGQGTALAYGLWRLASG